MTVCPKRLAVGRHAGRLLILGALLLVSYNGLAAPADEADVPAPARLGLPPELAADTVDRQRPVDTPPELEALQQLAPQGPQAPDESSAMRYEALREVAFTLGVQSGVRWRYDALNALMQANGKALDRIFDFRPLMLHDGRVAPAVIDKSEGAYRISTPTEASQTQATYYIQQDARLVSRPPNWRDYLLRQYPAFQRPDDVMLPDDSDERRVWSATVAKGFWEGVAQADRLFDINLSRLRRDYLGMARFKLLALQGVVDVPMLADSNLGVVVNGRMLSIGERLFRITTPTAFRPVRRWRPVIRYIPAAPSRTATGQETAK